LTDFKYPEKINDNQEKQEKDGRMIITFDWPVRALSPNARVHWAVKAKSAKIYREYCYVQARKQMVADKAYTFGTHLDIKFYPKTRRHYDLDNALASCKQMLDGIAQAMGIDDCQFSVTIAKMPETLGIITVELKPGPG
jgi:crossover junction endodeoxyribonuclease RusA